MHIGVERTTFIAEQSAIHRFDVTGKCRPAPYVDDAEWAVLKARICGGGCSNPGLSGDVADLARRAIAGEFGNGDARRDALGSSYGAVQACVNEMLGRGGSNGGGDVDALALAVICGTTTATAKNEIAAWTRATRPCRSA